MWLMDVGILLLATLVAVVICWVMLIKIKSISKKEIEKITTTTERMTAEAKRIATATIADIEYNITEKMTTLLYYLEKILRAKANDDDENELKEVLEILRTMTRKGVIPAEKPVSKLQND